MCVAYTKYAFRSQAKLCICWRTYGGFPWAAVKARQERITVGTLRAQGCLEGSDTDPDLNPANSPNPDEK